MDQSLAFEIIRYQRDKLCAIRHPQTWDVVLHATIDFRYSIIRQMQQTADAINNKSIFENWEIVHGFWSTSWNSGENWLKFYQWLDPKKIIGPRTIATNNLKRKQQRTMPIKMVIIIPLWRNFVLRSSGTPSFANFIPFYTFFLCPLPIEFQT